jgi:ribose transport system ATP-binding protein
MTQSETLSAPILELRGVSKHFDATRALHDVSLRIWPGEVHGLVGQNGSGKSTLIKIISGFEDPDTGAGVLVQGNPARFPIGRALNVSVVHQDLAVFDIGSVADNIMGPRWTGLPTLGRISWKKARAEAARSCHALGLHVDMRARVAELAAVEKAMLACVRALKDAEAENSLLLLDEPTTYMTDSDAARFNSFVRQLARDRGVAVLYVSHRLREVLAVCDTITVLRDGEVAAELEAGKVDVGAIVVAMLGQAMDVADEQLAPPGDEVILALRDLNGRTIRHLDLDIHAGEIVGVTGLVGMGQDDLPYVIRDAMGRTSPIGLVPGDRHTLGGWMSAPAFENLSIAVIDSYWQGGFLRVRPQVKAAEAIIEDLSVVPPKPKQPLGLFSGGNQQKLILGRALQSLPRVLVLHEPFQGVDVRARAELSRKVRSLAAERGLGVVLCSSDAGDLAATCHRVLILHSGQVAATVHGENTTEEDIVRACQRAGETQLMAEPAEER